MFNINSWLGNFTANLFSDVIVGIGVGIIVYKLIENKEKNDELKKLQERHKEKLKIVVAMIWAEVKDNKKQLQLLISNLSIRPNPNLIYPALSTSGWEIADKPFLIDALKPKDFSNLLKIYNRTYTLNKMYYSMTDKINWILEGEKSKVKEIYINALIDRAKELKDYIDEVFPIK